MISFFEEFLEDKKTYIMTNGEKCVQALHSYIDSLGIADIYEVLSDQELHGPDILDCAACENYYHGCVEDIFDDGHIVKHEYEGCRLGCKERFLKWAAELARELPFE